MSEWTVAKSSSPEAASGSKAELCLTIGDTKFRLTYADSGTAAPPDLLHQIAYEHNLAAPEVSATEAAAAFLAEFGQEAPSVEDRVTEQVA